MAAVDCEVGLIVDPEGRPVAGVALIQFLRIDRPRHSPFGGDARVYAMFEAIEFPGVLGLKVWTMGHKCRPAAPNAPCSSAQFKPGISGYLRRDFQVAIRRPPRRGDPLGEVFLGKIFRAELGVVERDSQGRSLPAPARYTRCLRLLEVAAGRVGVRSITTIPFAPPIAQTHSNAKTDAISHTDTKGTSVEEQAR